jgi:hypothetical protein
MKLSRLIAVLVVVTVSALIFIGCAHQPAPLIPNMPGFWKGLVHGFVAPISFIVSLFSDNRMYAFPNAGRWYDFGFMIGIGGFGGGIFGASRNKRHT